MFQIYEPTEARCLTVFAVEAELRPTVMPAGLNERLQPRWRAEGELLPAFAGLAKLCTLAGAASDQRKRPFLYFFQKVTCRPAEALL